MLAPITPPIVYLVVALLAGGTGIVIGLLLALLYLPALRRLNSDQEDIVARRRLPYRLDDGLLDASAVIANTQRWVNDLAVMISHLQAMLEELRAGTYDAEQPNIKGRLPRD